MFATFQQHGFQWFVITLIVSLLLVACDDDVRGADSPQTQAPSEDLDSVVWRQQASGQLEEWTFALFLRSSDDDIRQSRASTLTPQIGRFQEWVIELKDRSGAAIYPARFRIAGGMPAHGHGLPTLPKVTEYLGDGRYLVEGLKFNMGGMWVLTITAQHENMRDYATLRFELRH